MQNKKLKYVLLPLALILWGFIFYKIYSYVTNTPDNIQSSGKNIKEQTINNVNDTFEIVADYRDPFLGNQYLFDRGDEEAQNYNSIEKNSKDIQKKEVKEEVKTVVKTANWPKISYLGVIVNQKSSRKTVLIKVNNKEYMFRETDKIENVLLKTIYVDSVILSFNEEIKMIEKIKN